jgi:hypothetical protein
MLSVTRLFFYQLFNAEFTASKIKFNIWGAALLEFYYTAIFYIHSENVFYCIRACWELEIFSVIAHQTEQNEIKWNEMLKTYCIN